MNRVSSSAKFQKQFLMLKNIAFVSFVQYLQVLNKY